MGAEITLEERDSDEVLIVDSHRMISPGARGLNPAFDVSPAELVSAIVTEVRVVRPALRETMGARVSFPQQEENQ